MAGGAGVGAALGGFGQSLASVLGQTRRDQMAKDYQEQQRTLQSTLAILPTVIQLGMESGDFSLADEMVGRINPDLAKRIKKEGSPFPTVMPLLQPPDVARMTEEQDAAIAAGQNAPAPPPLLPARSMTEVVPSTLPGASFLGMRVLTPEQRREQQIAGEIDATDRTRRAWVQLAQKILPELQAVDPAFTLEDALRYVSKGELMTAASQRQASMYRYGVDREALSKAIFNKPYDQLTLEEAQTVIDEEKKMLEAEANARGTGTATARFNAQIDIPTAQATGQPVGTRASDLAGATVLTQDQQARMRSLDTLQGDLVRIEQLLDILPSERELAGLAPGAAFAIRRRSNADSGLKDERGQPLSRRAAVARLQSAVDNMVNVMARARAEQRGTQTERDAERAYNAVVQLQAGLSDPLGGDTRESARARLQEALDGLARVRASAAAVTPAVGGARQGTETPGAAGAAGAAGGTAAPAAPAGSAAPAAPGFTMDAQGNLYRDGQLVLPVQ